MLRCQLSLALTQTAFVLGAVYFKYNLKNEDPVHRLNPVVFAFAREASAGAIMCALAYVTTHTVPRRSDLSKFFTIGTLVYFNQLCYIVGVELSGVVIATCMQPAIPVFTAAIAISIGNEIPSVRKSIGIVTASAGAICMVAGGSGLQTSNASANAVTGNIFLLLNTVAMAFYYIKAKEVLKDYPPMAVAAWAYMIAACNMGVTALFYNQLAHAEWYLPPDAFGPLLYWVFVCSVCGYYIIAWAMLHLPSTQVAAFQCLQPLVGTLLGFMILGEELTFWDFGALGVIGGLVLVHDKTEAATATPKQLLGQETTKPFI